MPPLLTLGYRLLLGGRWVFFRVPNLNKINKINKSLFTWQLDIWKCFAGAVSYQGFSIDLVSFVPPFGKIVGFLLTFPFYIGSGGHSLG